MAANGLIGIKSSELLEPAHRIVAAFDAPVILLQDVVLVLAGPVLHGLAEFLGDGLGITGVAVGRDAIRLDLSDRLG